MMRREVAVAAAVMAIGSCAPRPRPPCCVAPAADDAMTVRSPAFAARSPRRLAADVSVVRIAPGLWVHTTTAPADQGIGAYPANGMLLETPDASVLIDTGWNDAQARTLLDWARDGLHHPVRRAVVTHFHDDRLGGTAALRAAGVDVRGLALTRELALREGNPAPDSVPGLAERPWSDAAGFEVRYAGPGHTRDNVVVWFPAQRVIFGGCLVKSDTATTVGNVRDADVEAWPRTVAAVRAAYPAVRLVVPGHGRVSGPGALAHTEELIATKAPR